MNKIILMAGACAILVGVPADAQDATFAAEMRAINATAPAPNSNAVEAAAISTLQAIAKKSGRCVPTGIRMEKPTPATADRLAVLGVQTGRLTNLWLVYGKAVGCGNVPQTRFIILQKPDGTVVVPVVNTGESITSPTLMRDTSASAAIVAMLAARKVDQTCDGRDIDFTETKVRSKSADLSPDFFGVRYRGSWEEAWTFSLCGHSVSVPVSFRADGTGGAYSSVDQKAVTLTAR